MLVCPRCGDKYEETGLRTMCPRCLVALEKREGADAEAAAAMPETAMPSVGMADMEMPPVGMAETAMPSVGMPEAAMPEIAAADAAAPPPPAAAAEAPTAASRAAPPTTTGRPAAPRERAERRGRPKAAPTRRTQPTSHPHEEYSDLSTIGWAILAAFLTILAVRGTIGLLVRGPHPVSVVWTGGLWFVVVLTTRMWLSRYHVRAVQFHLPSSIGLGAEVPYRLVLTPARRLPVDRATLLLRAEERVRSFSNNTEKTLRVERFRTTVEICRDMVLAGNQEAVFEGTFALPEHAPPSFGGEHNSVLWTARLWIGMPGWRPDVRQRLDLTVLPIVPSRPQEPAAGEHSVLSLPALESCGARLVLEAPVDDQGAVHVRAGGSVEGRLRLRPREEIRCRRIVLQVGYAIVSRGQDERRATQSDTLWEGDLKADREIEVPVSLRAPAAGPISYDGHNFDIHWSAGIRVDIPLWTDLAAAIPMVVEPGARAAASP